MSKIPAMKGETGRSRFPVPLKMLTVLSVAFVMIIGCVVIIDSDSSDAYDFEVDGLQYTITDGSNVSVTGYTGSPTSVVIPSTVTNGGTYNITSIGMSAFDGCTTLTSVTIPDSVTTIGQSAFYNCTSLASVIIGNSVQTIGVSAFNGCTALASVTFGNSVQTIGMMAFRMCPNIQSVTLPNTITLIDEAAFAGCALNSVTIGDESNIVDIPMEIRDEAFWDTHLERIHIAKLGVSFLNESIKFSSSYTDDIIVTAPVVGGNIQLIPASAFYNYGGQLKYIPWALFDANGGTCDTPSAHTGDDRKLSSLPVPTRDGYSFDGWFTEVSGGDKIELTQVFTTDTTIYAHWTAGTDSGNSIWSKDVTYIGIVIVTTIAAMIIIGLTYFYGRKH